jgi:membrane-associated phospholipid phosphatase
MSPTTVSLAPLPDGPAVLLVVCAAGAAIGLNLAVWWLLTTGGALAVQAGARFGASSAAARSRPLRASLEKRFPKLYRFVAARLDPHRFNGLPLTLICIAAIYLAFLFFGLVEDVMESEEIDAFDDLISALVTQLRNPKLVRVFTWVTQFGSTATLSAVAIVATGFVWARGPNWGVPAIWLTVAGSQVTTWTGKFLIERERPDFVLDITAWSPSFPSGHATGAMAVYGIVAYVIARDLTSFRRRFDVIYWTGVLIAVVAISRVYLSVHFASDIVAGVLVGGFWLLAGITAAELLRR